MKNTNIFAETLKVSNTKYVYRVEHRIMEGDCDYDHGPREVEIKDLEVSTYPVTNSMFKIFIEKTKYCPQDTHNYSLLGKKIVLLFGLVKKMQRHTHLGRTLDFLEILNGNM
jgi:formylglycine-generating enzyme required for sulfatase activity